MAHAVSLKRAHSEEFEEIKRQRTSVDHTPLFFTIYGQLEADEGHSSAVQIAELLSTNQDILIPFQQSSIREATVNFRLHHVNYQILHGVLSHETQALKN
ncbi:MAG: hypothetical protein JSR93_05545 [Verrucomicrobia bacterium]|nr:hypothetical protein [Verrucomicrobiota bacterium]